MENGRYKVAANGKWLTLFVLMFLKIRLCPTVTKIVKMSSRWNTCPREAKQMAINQHVGSWHTFNSYKPFSYLVGGVPLKIQGVLPIKMVDMSIIGIAPLFSNS